MLALRELIRPIPDAALPNLEQHKRRGALACAAIAGCADAIGNLVDALNGTNNPARVVPNVLLNALVCGSIFLALRKPGHRSADPALVAIASLMMVNLMTNGWIRYDGRHDLVPYAIMVPFAVAVFAPWRPTYSLFFGVLGAAVTLVCHATKVMILPTDPVTHAVMCVIAGLCGAGGAQLQRRLWLSLEGARAQLAAAERMTSLGRMTAGVAHELKTPLACAMNATASLDALTGELEQSIGHPDVTPEDLRAIAKDYRDLLDLVRVSVNRSTQFIHAMRAHTVQLGSDETSVLDVAKVVHSSLTLLAHEVRRSGVTVDASGVDPAVTCAGDGGKLGQIITNLVNNALDACADRPGARVTVSAVAVVGVVRLTVADDGPGVPEALRERIFDLLFTTRASHGGTGVGLALSRDLAEGAFGGTLRLVPSERGACFVLEVPRERPSSASATAPRAAAAPWSPSATRGAERPLADAVPSIPPFAPAR